MQRYTVRVQQSQDIYVDIHAASEEQAQRLAVRLIEDGNLDENANELTELDIADGGIVEWPPMGEPSDYEAADATLEKQPTEEETAAWLAKVRRCIEDTAGDASDQDDILANAGLPVGEAATE